MAATCCSDCASSASRCAWPRDTSAVAFTRSPTNSIPWCSSWSAASASAATAPMSRTFVSPDCIARAAASIPARSSETSSATSRADFPASAASARTSSATTAKPSPCSSARAASIAALSASRCVCRAIRAIVWANTPIRSDIPVSPALHGGDRATDLLDHAIEAPLEEAELVGLTCRRAHGEIASLRLPHHAPSMADPRDQRGRDALERHRHEDEHHRFEPCVPQAPDSLVQRVVEEARAEIGEGGCEDQEVSDGVALIERVGQHCEEEGRDQTAVPKPDDQDRYQDDIEQR